MLSNFIKHFNTITHHKLLVMQGCFKLGLYKQGLLHDLSKYTKEEFDIGIKYYQGNRSPNTAEVEDKGYSTAWLHHKGRNKHHFEYYIDFNLRSNNQSLRFAPMPDRYIAEMLVDRVVACKIYNKDSFKNSDPWDYYIRGNTKDYLHEETRKKLELLLQMYKFRGEDYTYKYIKRKILHQNIGEDNIRTIRKKRLIVGSVIITAIFFLIMKGINTNDKR